MKKYIHISLFFAIILLVISCSEWKVAPKAFNLKGTIVFCGSSNGNVYALDTAGNEIWKFATGNPMNASPFFVNGVLYVVNQVGKVYALNFSTGKEKWSFSTGIVGGYGNKYSSPVVADGVLYIGSTDKNMYALDAETGVKKWEFLTGGEIKSSPSIYDGKVYFGSYDNTFYALDAKTSNKVWSVKTGGPIWSSPAVSTQFALVYVGSGDKNLYAFNAQTGVMTWTFLTGGAVDSSPLVASNRTIYVGSRDQKLYALDGLSGQVNDKPKWQYPTGAEIFSSPTLTGENLYVGNDAGKVFSLNTTTGKPKWEFLTNNFVSSSPVIANGILYVGSYDKKFYAVNVATQKVMWKFTDAQVDGAPIVVQDGKVIGDYPSISGVVN